MRYHMEAALTAGTVAGMLAAYGLSVTQLTPGPGELFSKARSWILSHDAIAELAYCGWCGTPYASLVAYPIIRKLMNCEGYWLLGYIVCIGVCAFLRHEGERR